MADLLTIQRELVKLALIYQNPPKGADELEEIALIWLEDMAHVPNEDLVDAIRCHRRTSKFFPCPADILEHRRRTIEARERDRFFLPEDTGPRDLSDAQRTENQKKVRELLEGIGGKDSEWSKVVKFPG